MRHIPLLVGLCLFVLNACSKADDVASFCVYSMDDNGRRVALTTKHTLYLSVLASSRVANPEQCISSGALINKLELERKSSGKWRIRGSFEKGAPPFTPDCGGGTANLTLGKLPPSQYSVESDGLKLTFDVRDDASRTEPVCTPRVVDLTLMEEQTTKQVSGTCTRRRRRVTGSSSPRASGSAHLGRVAQGRVPAHVPK